MKFTITKSSDWNYKSEKEINTLEELMDFQKENGSIILQKQDDVELIDGKYTITGSHMEIEIYDYYRE